VLLRVVPWLQGPSLRQSEAELALQVLESGQVPTMAPGLQLLLRAAAWVAGTGELALRAIPLIAGLGALAVFVFLARRHLPARMGMLAVVAFALSSPLVSAASQLQADATDVVWATGLLLVGLRAYARAWIGWRTIALLGGFGVAAVLCSPATVFPLVGVGTALARRAGARRLAAGCLAAAWLLSAWLAHGIPTPALKPSLQGLAVLDAVGATPWGLTPLGVTLLLPSIALMVTGAVVLWRRGEIGLLLMLALPPLLALPAAILGLLPATFAVAPGLMILLAYGIGHLWGEGRLGLAAGLVASVLVLGMPLVRGLVGLILPPSGEEMRSVLALVADRHKPGDTLFVYPDARPAFDYYHKHRSTLNLADTLVVRCKRTPCSEHLAALGPLPRVWIVMASGRPPEQLDRDGDRLTEHRARGAACYLFDLKSAGEQTKKNAGVGPGAPSH
jgi:hypothetical protein